MEDLNKVNGDTLSAAEFMQSINEVKSLITQRGQTLSGADSTQSSQALVISAGSDDYYLDTGSADTYILSTASTRPNPILYSNGMQVRFIPANTNTGGVLTVDIAGLGAKSIVNESGFSISGSEIRAGEQIAIYFVSALNSFVIPIAGSSGTVFGISKEADLNRASTVTLAPDDEIVNILMPAGYYDFTGLFRVFQEGLGVTGSGFKFKIDPMFNVFNVSYQLTVIPDGGSSTITHYTTLSQEHQITDVHTNEVSVLLQGTIKAPEGLNLALDWSQIVSGASNLILRRASYLSFLRNSRPLLPNVNPPPSGSVTVFITSSANNINLLTLFLLTYPPALSGDTITFQLTDPGISIGSTNILNPGMRTDVWPAGVSLILDNTVGAGIRGKGGDAGAVGESGGTALLVEHALSIDNDTGLIGGGGGGGANSKSESGTGGGSGTTYRKGGGGGAGSFSGQGGSGTGGSGANGSSGGLNTGGLPGTFFSDPGQPTLTAGSGGDIGQPGGNSDISTGGGAGAAIDGASLVTILSGGASIYGPQIN